jgi:hypothetical protein
MFALQDVRGLKHLEIFLGKEVRHVSLLESLRHGSLQASNSLVLLSQFLAKSDELCL